MSYFLDLIDRINWNEYVHFFSQGNPPLAFQLLVANSIIFVLLLVRNTVGRSYTSSHTVRVLQMILLFVNAVLLFHEGADFY